jgi:hypothetical protein
MRTRSEVTVFFMPAAPLLLRSRHSMDVRRSEHSGTRRARSSESWGARYAGDRSDGAFGPRKWRQCTRTDPARRVLSRLPAGHPPGCAPARHILGLVIAVDKWITSRLDTSRSARVRVTRHAPLGPSCLRESVGETSPGSESAKIGIAGSTPACYRRDGRSQPPGPLLESGSVCAFCHPRCPPISPVQ